MIVTVYITEKNYRMIELVMDEDEAESYDPDTYELGRLYSKAVESGETEYVADIDFHEE